MWGLCCHFHLSSSIKIFQCKITYLSKNWAQASSFFKIRFRLNMYPFKIFLFNIIIEQKEIRTESRVILNAKRPVVSKGRNVFHVIKRGITYIYKQTINDIIVWIGETLRKIQDALCFHAFFHFVQTGKKIVFLNGHLVYLIWQ